MTVVENLTLRLAEIFLPPTLPIDFDIQEEAIRQCLVAFVTCRRRVAIDQIISILELLPYFFLSPTLYNMYFAGDWGETLPDEYEEIRAYLDEHWNELYTELQS